MRTIIFETFKTKDLVLLAVALALLFLAVEYLTQTLPASVDWHQLVSVGWHQLASVGWHQLASVGWHQLASVGSFC